jgi:MFS family permease
LAQPDIRQTLVVTFFSRMPVGMISLSMVMFFRDVLGSFKLAGSLLGLYFLASAIASPIKGRLIDRIGPALPLRVCGVLDPLLFAVVIALAWLAAPTWALVVAVALMGVFVTPVATLTRAMWRHRFESDELRRKAFAVDSVLMEINFTLGPALIGMVLAFSNPRVAILFAWLGVAASIVVFMRSPLLKYWKHEPHAERHPLGPLSEPQLILLFVLLFAIACACGMLEVAYPAYATHIAAPAFAGVLLGVNSFGSAVGGALFGATNWKWPLEKQFALLIATFGVLMSTHMLVDANESKLLFAIVAFIAGAAISPAFATQALLISRLAPAKYTTEAFTWSSTFIVSGLGAGMALGGALSEIYFVKTPFLAGAGLLMLAAVLASLLRVANAAPPNKNGRP